MISGHGTIETAVRATKLGAYDFLEKPLSIDRTLILIKHAIDAKTAAQREPRLEETVAVQERDRGRQHSDESAAPADRASWRRPTAGC